jgi:hypothetical protein
VAGPHYEDVFCLGQHALMDTGKCVSDAAGASAPRPRAALDGVASRLASATPVSSPVPIRP